VGRFVGRRADGLWARANRGRALLRAVVFQRGVQHLDTLDVAVRRAGRDYRAQETTWFVGRVHVGGENSVSRDETVGRDHLTADPTRVRLTARTNGVRASLASLSGVRAAVGFAANHAQKGPVRRVDVADDVVLEAVAIEILGPGAVGRAASCARFGVTAVERQGRDVTARPQHAFAKRLHRLVGVDQLDVDAHDERDTHRLSII